AKNISRGLESPATAGHLFTRNCGIDDVNAIFLSKMTTEAAEALAVNIVQGTVSNVFKTECLKRAHDLETQDTMVLSQSVTLKVDAPYVITVNIDTLDGLVNGVTFYLRQIIYGPSQEELIRPHVLLAEFEDQRVGNIARQFTNHGENLMPIYVQRRMIYQWHGRGLSVVRIQFQVTPAAAISAWKAQGGTY
ncbi:unnamed protein product, partial [Allacma fusca]